MDENFLNILKNIKLDFQLTRQKVKHTKKSTNIVKLLKIKARRHTIKRI